MPRQQKLKVYRTPIGFHDAYVAAPSQKAALAAWGSEADLFARGIAELVTDEELSRAPLEQPGKVIKRSRGSVDEQLAALPPDRPKAPARKPADAGPDDPGLARRSARRTPAKASGTKAKPAEKPTPKPKPKPKPSRDALDEAERRLAELIEQQEAAEAELRERERALAKERRLFDEARARDRKQAKAEVEKERAAHGKALDRWLDEQ